MSQQPAQTRRAGGEAGRGRAAGPDRAANDQYACGRRWRLGACCRPQTRRIAAAQGAQSAHRGHLRRGSDALAPSLRRLPALVRLSFFGNPLGDEALAALVAPPTPTGAPPPTTGGWRRSQCSTSIAPRSPTPAAPPSPQRSTAARKRRAAGVRAPLSFWTASLGEGDHTADQGSLIPRPD